MKTYTLARGGFAGMYREKIGSQVSRRNHYPACEVKQAPRAAEALDLYGREWNPGDAMFEVSVSEAAAALRGGAAAAWAFTVIREVPDTELFGKHAARAARITTGLSNGNVGAAGDVMQAWRALPDGYGHCAHGDGDECDCEAAPGSRGTLDEFNYPSGEDIPDKICVGHSLLSGWAVPIAADYAAALWWYEAGRQGADAGHYNAYWRRPGEPRLEGMGGPHEWRDTVKNCFTTMIGAALCWQYLAAEDRKAWESLAAPLAP